jgi:hypothetical protein
MRRACFIFQVKRYVPGGTRISNRAPSPFELVWEMEMPVSSSDRRVSARIDSSSSTYRTSIKTNLPSDRTNKWI